MTQEHVPEPSSTLGRLTEALAEAGRVFSQQMDVITSPLRDALAALSAVMREHQRRVDAPLREAVQRMALLHAVAAKVHDQVLDALLRRGWCHSYHFTDAHIIYLGELASAGRDADIDEFMAEFTRREMDRILTTAVENYPDRAAILTDAFKAHRAGKFTLSIPTLLAQVDGIGCDALGLDRHFFTVKKREQGLATTVAGLKWPWDGTPYHLGGVHERMLSALTLRWALALDTNERGADGSPLNRHGVLHGLDTGYPTEFNSLRCVLLLGFVLEVRKVLHEDIPGHLRELGETLDPSSA
jgi:hypothetical protein